MKPTPTTHTTPAPRKSRPIDTAHVCQHLTWLFNNATANMGRETSKGTPLYKLQVEFAYFLDEIQRGATYIIPKVIADCNQFISDIITANKKTQ